MNFRGCRTLALACLLALPLLGCTTPSLDSVCQDHPEICDSLDQARSLDGVRDLSTSTDVLSHEGLDEDSLLFSVTAVLDENLPPERAGSTARQLYDLLEDAFRSERNIAWHGEVNAGVTPGEPQPVLDVALNENSDQQVRQSFILMQAGAIGVHANAAEVSDAAALGRLAELAYAQHFQVELRTTDNSLRYTVWGEPDLEKLELFLEVAGMDSVASAGMDTSKLSVNLAEHSSARNHEELERWLIDHRPLRTDPLPFILFGPSYDVLAEGWLGDKKPSHLIPKPVVLPEGITPWPQDPRAPECTGHDLVVAPAGSDAAAGSRFLQLNVQNISSRTCALEGVPDIRFINTKGNLQRDVTLEPMPDVLAERIAIPAGESAMSAVKWSAASTSLDPDVTTRLEVRTTEQGLHVDVPLITNGERQTLDILDGSTVSVSPWVQAMKGWGTPRPAE
ncbi:hypothetical protein GCM10027417_07430 [Glutamicibacter endophyticus]